MHLQGFACLYDPCLTALFSDLVCSVVDQVKVTVKAVSIDASVALLRVGKGVMESSQSSILQASACY